MEGLMMQSFDIQNQGIHYLDVRTSRYYFYSITGKYCSSYMNKSVLVKPPNPTSLPLPVMG